MQRRGVEYTFPTEGPKLAELSFNIKRLRYVAAWLNYLIPQFPAHLRATHRDDSRYASNNSRPRYRCERPRKNSTSNVLVGQWKAISGRKPYRDAKSGLARTIQGGQAERSLLPLHPTTASHSGEQLETSFPARKL
jgi:hypothetical protein